jgi:hypothetical protein
MPDPKGWPDTANPGKPTNPMRDGPHLIEDEHGARRWCWWDSTAEAWTNGSRCHPSAFAASHWFYIGTEIKLVEPKSSQTPAEKPLCPE